MKIIHIAYLDHSRCDGVMTVLDHLPEQQRVLGHKVFIFNINTRGISTNENEYIIHNYKTFKNLLTVIQPDLVVFHIIYNLYCYLYAFALRKQRIPYLIQFHGGTSAIAQKKSRWKKMPINKLFTYKFIKQAKGGIFLNRKEQEECVFPQLIHKSCIIPNGINSTEQLRCKYKQGDIIKVLFLSRIDVIGKGLNLLIPAWLQVKKSNINAELHICGDIKSARDKRIFNKLLEQNDGSIIYHGQVDGSKKLKMLNDSNIFILVSQSEGMPMSVLEALSNGLPCILSPQTNMTEYIIKGQCGWSTQLKEEDIFNTLLLAISDYQNQSQQLHENARQVSKLFSWDIVAQTSILEYKKILQ